MEEPAKKLLCGKWRNLTAIKKKKIIIIMTVTDKLLLQSR